MLAAHRFGRVEFWISNICCCFLQASAVVKIKTNIQNSTRRNQWATEESLMSSVIKHQYLFIFSFFRKVQVFWKGHKVWKNLPLVSTNVKTSGRFFQNLWPSHLTWISLNSLPECYLMCNWNSDLVKFMYFGTIT